MIPLPPSSTLFPYTTLFRSNGMMQIWLGEPATWTEPVASLIALAFGWLRSEEHTSELQSRGHLVCRLLLEKKNDILNFMLITETCVRPNIAVVRVIRHMEGI